MSKRHTKLDAIDYLGQPRQPIHSVKGDLLIVLVVLITLGFAIFAAF